MRRGGWMAGQRLRVADVDESLHQLERVVELLPSLEAALDAKRHQGRRAALQIFLCELVIGVVWKSRVVDPLDSAVAIEKLGDASAVLDVPLDPQRHGFAPLQQEKRAHRRP